VAGRKALFVDRDGTINVDCPYCHKVEDLRIYADSVDILKQYSAEGFLIVMVTNQSGIGRGYFGRSEMESFNDEIISFMKKNGVEISAVYFCPHLPEEGCNCRKPSTGLFEQAARELDIDLTRSVVLGDRDDIDGEAARRLGIRYRIVKRSGNESLVSRTK
jgi:histidinol-phosphate phosphatase family protein